MIGESPVTGVGEGVFLVPHPMIDVKGGVTLGLHGDVAAPLHQEEGE